MRLLAAAAASAALVLGGCSAEASFDRTAVDAWEPQTDDIDSVPCAELRDQWSDLAASPDRCWTFEETDGLDERFRTLATQVQAVLDAEPPQATECVANSALGRTESCFAVWPAGEQAVVLSSSITRQALESAVAGEEPVPASTPLPHELALWVGDPESS